MNHPKAQAANVDEAQILGDFNAGRLRSIATPSLLAEIKEAAKATGNKDQRINIRLSSGDLQAIRARALREGIPYQTLISSVLHQYVNGTLHEHMEKH